MSPTGEDHRHVVAVGDLDGHLVADGAAGLDDRRDAALRRELDGVREREIGVGREHGNRVALPRRDEVRALERIDRDVHFGLVRLAFAHLLADEQHRRFVALALPDDDTSAHLDLVHRAAHRLDGKLVGAFVVAAAHGARAAEGGRLRDPDHLEREERFHQWRKCRRPVKTIAM